jgi:hypothetical protein
VSSQRARAFDVIVYPGSPPPLALLFEQSPAEADFLDLQSNPRRSKEWAQHCADARSAWHKRTGVKPRKVER